MSDDRKKIPQAASCGCVQSHYVTDVQVVVCGLFRIMIEKHLSIRAFALTDQIAVHGFLIKGQCDNPFPQSRCAIEIAVGQHRASPRWLVVHVMFGSIQARQRDTAIPVADRGKRYWQRFLDCS